MDAAFSALEVLKERFAQPTFSDGAVERRVREGIFLLCNARKMSACASHIAKRIGLAQNRKERETLLERQASSAEKPPNGL